MCIVLSLVPAFHRTPCKHAHQHSASTRSPTPLACRWAREALRDQGLVVSSSQPGAADSSASLWSVPPAKREGAAAVVAAAVAAKKLPAEPATAPHKRQRISGPSTPARPLVAAAEGRRAKHKKQRAPAGGSRAAAAAAAAVGTGQRHVQQEQRTPAQQHGAAAVHRRHRPVGQQQAPAAAAAAAAAGARAPAAGTAGGEQRVVAGPAAAGPVPAPAAPARAPVPAPAAAAATAAARVPQPPGAGRGPAPVPEDPTVPWVAAQLDGPSTGAMPLAQALNRLGVWAGLKPAQVRCTASSACSLGCCWTRWSARLWHPPIPHSGPMLSFTPPNQSADFGVTFVELPPADRRLWYKLLRKAAEQQVSASRLLHWLQGAEQAG